MKNIYGDLVAKSMDSLLKSDDYKKMFKTAYKKCAKCDKPCEGDECEACDMQAADTQAADSKEEMSAEMKEEAAYADAIANLITASEALDSLGFAKSASKTLEIASIVIEAKKLTKEEQKAKMKALRDKAKAKKEEMAAKVKAKKEKEKLKKEEMAAKAKAKKEKEKMMAEEKAKKMLEKAKEKGK